MSYVKITGTVVKPLGEVGWQVDETVNVAFGPSAGKSFPVKWAVWTKENLNIGDLVDVSGVLALKQREYLDEHGIPKTTIDRSINECTIKVARAAAPATGSEPF
jgi:hypothetical protein